MARTASPAPGLHPARRTDSRPTPFLKPHCDTDDGYSEIDNWFYMHLVDNETIVMIPTSYEDDWDRDSSCEWAEGGLAWRCWKTSVVYDFMGATHPRVAEYKGADAWTALPLFKKPSGPSLDIFLAHHRRLFYPTDSRRVEATFLPIVYQWVLHLLSAIEFLHSREIIIGQFDLCNCWLSNALELSLVGFPSAFFHWGKYSVPFPSRTIGQYPFHPLYSTRRGQHIRPSKMTDLVLFGNSIYEVMTGSLPGRREEAENGRNLHDMYVRGEWPSLEERYLGEIAQKCWRQQYNSTGEVKSDLVRVLGVQGYEVVDGDILAGLDAVAVMGEDMKRSYPFSFRDEDGNLRFGR